MTASIVPGATSCPCSISSTSSSTTVAAACTSLGVAVEGQHVAAQVKVAVQAAPQRAQDGVLRARQLGGDGVVERQLPTRQASPAPPC